MKANEIKVGGRYIAKVNGKLTTVVVEEIGERYNGRTYYSVLNLATNRGTTFRSPTKFRCTVPVAAAIANAMARTQYGQSIQRFNEADCGGAFDGHNVISDADCGL